MNITCEIQQTTIMSALFLKISEKMMRLWGTAQSILLDVGITQGYTQIHINETIPNESWFGKKKNDKEK